MSWTSFSKSASSAAPRTPSKRRNRTANKHSKCQGGFWPSRRSELGRGWARTKPFSHPPPNTFAWQIHHLHSQGFLLMAHCSSGVPFFPSWARTERASVSAGSMVLLSDLFPRVEIRASRDRSPYSSYCDSPDRCQVWRVGSRECSSAHQQADPQTRVHEDVKEPA